MPATNPQDLFNQQVCQTCGRMSGFESLALALWDNISQNIGTVDPYDGVLWLSDGVNPPTIIPNPVSYTSVASAWVEIHCHNCPAFTLLNVALSASLVTCDIQNCAAFASLNISGCSALTTLDMATIVHMDTLLDFRLCTSLVNLDLSALQTVNGSYFYGSGCTSLVTLNLPSLTSIGAAAVGSLSLGGNTAMTTLNTPVLATLNGDLDISGCSALTSASFPALTSIPFTLNAHDCTSLVSFSAPILASISDQCWLYFNPAMTSVNLNSLTSVGLDLLFNGCGCVGISLPALASVGGNAATQNSASLVNWSTPNWLPTDGTVLFGDGCAFNAASVNGILARYVAAANTGSTIDLSGGTSAAPTGQGIIDKAALILAGNTVSTN